MKKRGLVIGLLMLLAVITSGFTYAFWASSVTINQSAAAAGSLTIGNGGSVTTTVLIGAATLADQDLVPTAYAPTPGGALNEDRVQLSFLVTWTGATAGANGATSTVSLTSFVFSGLGSLTHEQIDVMFDVAITSGSTVTVGTPSNVVVLVTFAVEPANQAIYEQVANGTLTATLTFTVAAVTVTPVVPNP